MSNALTYNPNQGSDFVHQNVLHLLGRVPGAVCTRMELTHRLRDWVGQFLAPATFVFDSKHDWQLLAVVMLGRPQRNPPGNFGKQLFLDSTVFVHPRFVAASKRAYTEELPMHHALADACALVAGYSAWIAVSGTA